MMSSLSILCRRHVVKLAAVICLMTFCHGVASAQETSARQPRPLHPPGEYVTEDGNGVDSACRFGRFRRGAALAVRCR